MVKQRKLHPGVGAKCTVLTKFIHPRRDAEKGHRTACKLTGRVTRRVNSKDQLCFLFSFDGAECFAVAKHFKVVEEGGTFFDDAEARAAISAHEKDVGFKEPKISWRKSLAKKVLYNFLLDGTVPVNDEDGTMTIEDIILLHEDLALYNPAKLPERLERLRQNLRDCEKRAEVDEVAFERYKANHKPSLFSHKGYIQWQGSNAQELLWDDIEAGKLNTMNAGELWRSTKAYQDEFPLDAFRKKVEQEVRTGKYIATLKARGIEHRSS